MGAPSRGAVYPWLSRQLRGVSRPRPGAAGRASTEGNTRGTTSRPDPGDDASPARARRGRRTWARGALVIGVIVAAALAVIASSRSPAAQRTPVTAGARPANGPAPTRPRPPTTSRRPPPEAGHGRAALSGTVWVCLVDNPGRPLIDAETLTPDQQRGPFKARGFRVTFGNGAIAMTVDDRASRDPGPRRAARLLDRLERR